MSRILGVILALLGARLAVAEELPAGLPPGDARSDTLRQDRAQALERVVRLLLVEGKVAEARQALEAELTRITQETSRAPASVADVRLVYWMGIVEELAGNRGRRDELFGRARALAPTDEFSHLLLAKTFEALEREDIAETEFRRVLELADERSVYAMEAVESLARSAYTNRRYGRAAELFAKLLGMLRATSRVEDPEEPLAQYEYLELVSRGFSLLDGGGADGPASALKTCERAWQVDPRRLDAVILGERIAGRWAETSRAEELRKTWRARSDRVAEFLRSTLVAFPRDPAGYNALAWFLAELDGDLDEGIRAAKHALELRPADPAFLDTLAELQFRKHDAAGTVKTLREVIDVYPFANGYYRRQLERFEAALKTPRAPGAP